MNLELLPSENLPANEAVFTCEGVKPCDKISRGNAVDQKEGSIDELPHRRDVDILNCSKLRRVIHEKDNLHGKELNFDRDDSIDCNELIAYWMMEGCLGQVDSVEESYQKGHKIFMDLRHVWMPRPEFYENKRIKNLASVSTYERYRGLKYTTMGLGFVDVFEFDKGETPRLGKLVPHNGVIRSLRTDKDEKCTCLLLDGNQLDRQVLGNFKRHLKNLAYFSPRTNVLERQLPTLNLTVLILRGCTFLEKIEECIGEMSDLEILEISGRCSIKEIPDIFKKVTKIRSLNLSYLGVERLPKYSFPKLIKLRRLILRGCYGLLELPSTRDMRQLEVIDLYGATSLKKLSTTNFRKHNIKTLDLTNTHVKRVPCLFDYINKATTVTHLFLRNILEIYVFDIVQKLLKLQVLDVSGAKNLKQINIEPLEHLVILDLSGTGLVSLPENCFHKLKKLTDLKLSNTNLSSLPSSISDVSTLQVLDLSGCQNLKGLGEISFGQWPSLLSLNLSDTSIEKFTILNSSGASSSNQHFLEHLQILNLSNTSIKELPSLSHLKSLMHLHLAGCSEIAFVPDLESLTVLEVLDLSGTKVENEVLDKASRNLRKLLLKGCSMIKGSLNLASFTLEELDLRGSGVTEFPEGILGMKNNLTRLCLPHQIRITGVDWSNIDNDLLRKISWDQPANVFESVKVVISNEVDHSMSAKPSKENHLFHLVDSQVSWEAYFKQFQFSPKKENMEAMISFDGVELVFKGHHPLARKEPYIRPQSPSVEIHGFSIFPEESKIALKKAVNVALVGYGSSFSLSDEYFQFAEKMKVCWINSCSKMEFALGSENAGVFGVLETLVLSNLTSLKAFCAKSSLSQRIDSLKHMYIDCCPKLENVISSSHLPENLETLHIKFCDELKVVCDGSGNTTSECKDEHEAVRDGSGNASKSKDEIKAVSEIEAVNDGSGNASKSKDEHEAVHDRSANASKSKDEIEAAHDGSANTSKSKDEIRAVSDGSANTTKFNLQKLHELNLLGLLRLQHIGVGLPSLQTLIISQCPELKDLGFLVQCARSHLTRLTLDSCPKFEYVFSSSMLPENIQELEIRSCDGLAAVFDPAGSSSSTSKPSFPTLHRLQLWNLPKLKSIGGEFPSLEKCEIKYCSRLLRELWPQVKAE